MTHDDAKVPLSAYAGLFFTALATLMFEILLTRIFSATTWYHFAFMAISVAMFGMTAGALAVYLKSNIFTKERALAQMASAAVAFAVSIPLSFLAHLCIPFEESLTVVGVASFALTYTVIAVPFFFSGIAICIALTKFPGRVSSLYGFDLAGAGVGCIALLYTLRYTDGPTAILVVAALAAFGALLFSLGGGRQAPRSRAFVVFVLLTSIAWQHQEMVARGEGVIDFVWVKGNKEPPVAYEKWNSFSRITVFEHENMQPSAPILWGPSPNRPRDARVRQYGLFIDGVAGTVITEFDGDASKLNFLKWDVTNVAHFLQRDAKVLIVGTGGGRDLLSALAFDQKEILGVELNPVILETVNQKYGDFSGHLDQVDRIRLVNDEARSYLARSGETYDLLQISLIDTWAATSAGAFVLAENALYTLEGWDIFLEHLEPGGMISVSRWFGAWSGELYRSVSLAVAALRAQGAEDPYRHLAVVTAPPVATLLVGREPLSLDDRATLRQVAEEKGYGIRLIDGESSDPILARLAHGEEITDFGDGLQLDLSPPTDNRPFFFNMLRLQDVFDPAVQQRQGLDANIKAVLILAILLAVVAALTLFCIVMPLFLTADRKPLEGSAPLFLFFASIGFGFMLVELSQMHRLILFLGHPTYGLSVVLFALLLSSGLGSMLTNRMPDAAAAGPRMLRNLLIVLVIFGVVTPFLAHWLEGAVTPVRIGVAVLLLFPLGLFMGMCFPLGLRLAAGRAEQLTPWLWGVNGATGVCASVLATGIALTFSIATAFWAGVACYGVAWLAFNWARSRAGAAVTS